MRQDARSLLERLGRNEFRYQEFEDPFADMELWPIFEALLRDDGVVGQRASALREADIQIRSARAEDAAIKDIFGKYGDTLSAIPAPESTVSPVNLRQYFGRFSEEK